MPLFKRKKKEKPAVVRGSSQSDVPTQELKTVCGWEPRGITLSIGSEIGTRSYQQDSYACSTVRDEFAAVVCDGMGGIEGGDQASQTAVSCWISMYEAGFSDFSTFVHQVVPAMDQQVSSTKGAGGTTVAAVWIKDGKLHWMSVGDSKIYLLRDRVMNIMTREHNYQMILDGRLQRNEITETEYGKEMKRGASLVSYIGRGQIPFVDISQRPVELKKGDVVIVCSDGLYKSIPEERIGKITAGYTGDFDTLAPYLLDYAASNAKSRDNTTVIAMRYEGTDVVFEQEDVVFGDQEP